MNNKNKESNFELSKDLLEDLSDLTNIVKDLAIRVDNFTTYVIEGFNQVNSRLDKVG